MPYLLSDSVKSARGRPAPEDPTERELWIMHKFGFLKSYISRHKGRQLGGLADKLAGLKPLPGEDSADEDGMEDIVASRVCTTAPASRCLTTTSVTSTNKTSIRKSMEGTICVCAIQSDRLAEHVADLIAEHDISLDFLLRV